MTIVGLLFDQKIFHILYPLLFATHDSTDARTKTYIALESNGHTNLQTAKMSSVLDELGLVYKV